MKTNATSAARALFMDNAGRIECPEHAPYRDSDSWVLGDWQPITQREVLAFERDVGCAPECETCAAIARRAAEK